MNMDRVIAVRNAKTVYRDGDRCVKVFNGNYSKAEILNEALNQARIEETGLPVPRILGVTMIDGKWAILSEFIRGKTLSQLMQEDPDHKTDYLNRFVDLQMEVQSRTCPMLNRLKDKMTRKISQADLDAATRYDLLARLEGMPAHSKVCHGDFRPSNILISEDGAPYIIDWSHVTQGNASADVARTYLLFWLNGDIGGAEEYLNLFCEKSGTPLQYVQKWMPIVAASQSVKGNEKERDFLLSWIGVVEYQ
ncbi:MAG: phosphotransferase [Clostridia bacterium]|nr:phosphotransferase [Clostridia bacterium]